MEWVETTGRTLEEAKEAALDQLGVDEQDAEFEVLEEPKSGLFGRLRTEARVRARVQPTTPRPKVERGERRRRSASPKAAATPTEAAPSPDLVDEAEPVVVPAAAAARPSRSTRPQTEGRPRPARPKGAAVEAETDDLKEVAASLQSFVEGLLDAFGVGGQVDVAIDEDDSVVEARIEGDELGLLIGPKGATLQAVQELARSAVAHGPSTRVRVDVGGYRRRRSEALATFTRTIAEQVLASGAPTSLEPMGAADRKVVHDTVNAIDGLQTTSEGEEPRRRVVISPE